MECDFKLCRGTCGSKKKHEPGTDISTKLRDLTEEEDGVKYGIYKPNRVRTSLAKVALQRAGKWNEGEELEPFLDLRICPTHQEKLGKRYLPSKVCEHPSHKGSCKPRITVDFKVAQDIKEKYSRTVSVGSKICRVCNDYFVSSSCNSSEHDGAGPSNIAETLTSDQWSFDEADKSSQETSQEADEPATSRSRQEIKVAGENKTKEVLAVENSVSSQSGSTVSSFIPSQHEIDPVSVTNSAMESLAQVYHKQWTPLTFQCHESPSKVVRSTKWRLDQSMSQGVSLLAETITPGHGASLIESFVEKQKNTSPAENKNTSLHSLISLHNKCEDQASKKYIVKLASQMEDEDGYRKFSTNEISQGFDVSKSQVKRYLHDKVEIKPKIKHTRMRLDVNEASNFIHLCHERNYLQPQSWGTQTMKFDSGMVEKVGLSVQTLGTSELISAYQKDANASGREPLSVRSCQRVVENIFSGKKTKAIAGLDSAYDAGNKALDKLNSLFEKLNEKDQTSRDTIRDLSDDIDEVRRHLKGDYKGHIDLEGSSVADHCPAYSLGSSTACSHSSHESFCEACHQVTSLFEDSKAVVDSMSGTKEDKEEIFHDINEIEEDVHAWRAHVMRTIVQNEAKNDVIQQLDDKSGLLIFDYGMKILASEHRESSSSYYGKRGSSLFGCVLIEKDADNQLKKTSYMTFADDCRQDSGSSVAFYDHTLKEIRKDKPYLANLYNKCDNAGTFHSWDFISGINTCAKNRGFNQKRIDFNEASSGKDQCDREFGVTKQKLRSLRNQPGVNQRTALEMKESLDNAEKRLKGVKFSAVKIPATAPRAQKSKQPPIADFHSFEYVAEGIKKQKYYNIAPGVVHSLPLPNSKPPKCELLADFEDEKVTVILPQKKKQKPDTEEAEEPFLCNEPGCGLSFRSRDEEEVHNLNGTHSFENGKETVYDTLRRVHIKSGSGLTQSSSSRSKADETSSTTTTPLPPKWAIPKSKRGFRFSEDQKSFLTELFEQGMRSRGERIDGEKAAAAMRTARLPNGTKRFHPNEYLKPSQCSSHFTKLHSMAKRGAYRSNESSSLPIQDENDYGDLSDDLLAETQEEQIEELAAQVVSLLDGKLDVTVGDFVLIRHSGSLKLGKVSQISASGEIEVSLMSYEKSTQTFLWPRSRNIVSVDDSDIAFVPDAPTRIAKGKRAFRLSDADQKEMDDLEAEQFTGCKPSQNRPNQRDRDDDSDAELNPPKRQRDYGPQQVSRDPQETDGGSKPSSGSTRGKKTVSFSPSLIEQETTENDYGSQQVSRDPQVTDGGSKPSSGSTRGKKTVSFSPSLIEQERTDNNASLMRRPSSRTAVPLHQPVSRRHFNSLSLLQLIWAANVRPDGLCREKPWLKPWLHDVIVSWDPDLESHKFQLPKLPDGLSSVRHGLLRKIQKKRVSKRAEDLCLLLSSTHRPSAKSQGRTTTNTSVRTFTAVTVDDDLTSYRSKQGEDPDFLEKFVGSISKPKESDSHIPDGKRYHDSPSADRHRSNPLSGKHEIPSFQPLSNYSGEDDDRVVHSEPSTSTGSSFPGIFAGGTSGYTRNSDFCRDYSVDTVSRFTSSFLSRNSSTSNLALDVEPLSKAIKSDDSQSPIDGGASLAVANKSYLQEISEAKDVTCGILYNTPQEKAQKLFDTMTEQEPLLPADQDNFAPKIIKCPDSFQDPAFLY